MVLHGTLPQVLAGAGTVQPEHEGVLLLAPLREEAKVHITAARASRECRGAAARGWGRGRKTYLVIILHHYEGQFALFKVHFSDLRPGQRESILKRAGHTQAAYTSDSFLSTYKSLDWLREENHHSFI